LTGRRAARWTMPILYLLFGTALLFAANGYVGSTACAACHKSEYERQVKSHHALALRPIADSPLKEMLLKLGHTPDGVVRYVDSGNQIALEETGLTRHPVLAWAFGAGGQGMTPVGMLDEQYFEHQFSYYSRPKTLAPTFGHPSRVSTPLAEIGVMQDGRTITSCFNCHATGVQSTAGRPDTGSLLPGVQCERCHGPGNDHIQAAKSGASREVVRRMLVNPGRFPPKALVQICGQCHRLPAPEMGDEPELEAPVTVRFAPIGLLASRCFQASGSLSCLTCHNPHEDARPAADPSYTQACLNCHQGTTTPIRKCRRVTKQNCVPCHMGQAALDPYLRFTNHRIRIR
jgi:hypothetical protein